MSDPLTVAVRELDDPDLANLLLTYRALGFGAETGSYRAVYLAIAAHFLFETRRRRLAWTRMVADLLDDGSAGEIVPDGREA